MGRFYFLDDSAIVDTQIGYRVGRGPGVFTFGGKWGRIYFRNARTGDRGTEMDLWDH